ncbi:conserved protein [Propionibacterium freudenreichii subsp. shermanii]|nr:conserved protein [Propionibacterium freudenreichii subsp. shermanii]
MEACHQAVPFLVFSRPPGCEGVRREAFPSASRQYSPAAGPGLRPGVRPLVSCGLALTLCCVVSARRMMGPASGPALRPGCSIVQTDCACSALTLLVARVGANYPHDTAATDHLAVLAHPLDARTNLHRASPLLNLGAQAPWSWMYLPNRVIFDRVIVDHLCR